MSSTKLLEEEITALCRSDSLSEDGLRGIIERHGIIATNNDITSYKFFHDACDNERSTEGILRYLLEYFPNIVRMIGEEGRLPIHTMLGNNKNVALGMVQLLIDAFPDSLRQEDDVGCMPLHALCCNKNLDDKEVGLEILKLLLERYPESVRHAAGNDRDGDLPIHIAARYQSPEFCRILIEAYHGSERITNDNGFLPFHFACGSNAVATAKYLYKLHPESINVVANNGFYPIHYAMLGISYRKDKPEIAISMIRFLLDCDPDVVHLTYQDKLPLYWICYDTTNNIYSQMVNFNLLFKALKMLYDAYPEAIESNEVTSDVASFHGSVKLFINSQLIYARIAKKRNKMTTRDENGQLPLHIALCMEVRLGSIKLLVKGNPSAVRTPDGNGALPLHLACLHYDDACIVEYLINLDPTSLRAVDGEGNTALHYACRGAKYDTIVLLLGKYDGVSVSKRNMNNQLPIDLLYESEAAGDKESIEYTESIFRLVRAYPDTVL